ncbi:hypothetical protein [uncultured Sphingomonas sp.]|uniref:hypothetical protein n=1 Tax=uncultured Sphingomonas sp. TaxID=158754 RepID=UPI0035CC0A91
MVFNRLLPMTALVFAAAPAAAQSIGPTNPSAPPIRTVAAPPPEVSHEAPINGVLTLYGNQRCPTDSTGSEVVVCVRQGASEQFRIPKGLREFKITPQNESWAKNQSLAMTAGNDGIGSCTAVGAGGALGCTMQQTHIAKAEAKARAKDATPDLTGY